MDVGMMLRNARERRRIAIEEMSAATKIPVPVLRAMEAGDFTRVPGGIFARGFLRAVAREVGLDPEEVVAHYVAELEPSPAASQSGSPSSAHDSVPVDGAGQPARGRAAAQILWLAAAALAWIVMARALSTESSGPIPAPPAPPVESVAAIEPDSEAPVALVSSGPSGPGAPGDAAIGTTGGSVRIDLQPRGDCWIEATADGAPVIYRLMRAGEHESIDIGAELVLRVGDPAAFAFEINGRAGRALGEPAIPVTVRVTSENYGDLLAR